MTKKYLGAAAAMIVLAGTAIAQATPAQAKSDNAATVTKDAGCTGFVPTAEGGVGDLLHTTKGYHRVDTRSGVTILSCQFDIPDNLTPAKVARANGFDCSAGGRLTNDTMMLATPGGRALLVCKING